MDINSTPKRFVAFLKIKALFLSVLLSLSSELSFAQRNDNMWWQNGTVNYDDYSIKFKWKQLPGAGGSEDHETTLQIQCPVGTYIYNKKVYQDYHPADSISKILGPNKVFSYHIFYTNYGWNQWSGNPEYWTEMPNVNGTTPKLKAPKNVKITEIPNISKGQVYPTITWEKQTAVPDAHIRYNVYRKKGNEAAVLLANLSAHVFSYTDDSLIESADYTYSVQTVIATDNSPAGWNVNPATDFDPAVVAGTFKFSNADITTTLDQNGRIRLSWNQVRGIAGLENLVLYRNGEELVQFSKNTTSYNDSDILPGMFYQYSMGYITDGVSGIDYENWRSKTFDGKSLANGKISGYVKGKTNAGVEGVMVTATTKSDVYNGKTTEPYTYSATTDASGYYEITKVFYGEGANYEMRPQMPGYNKPRFDPEKLSRSLSFDESNRQNVNFTDTASFAINGRVSFAAIKDSLDNDVFLPVQDAEVWLNGKNSAVKTDAKGLYSLSITNAGLYSVQIKYKDHLIYFSGTTDTVKSLYVNNLMSNVDFINTKTDTLTIKVAASCDAPIGEYVTFLLKSENAGYVSANSSAKYAKKLHISSNDLESGSPKNPGQPTRGEVKVILPATSFEGQVLQISEKGGINSNKLEYFTKTYNIQKVSLAERLKEEKIDTTYSIKTIKADTTFKPDGSIYKITPSRKDTTVNVDTTYLVKKPLMDFIYHDKLKVLVNNNNPAFVDSVQFAPGNTYKYLLAQNDKHLIDVKIQETYTYDGITYSCTLDTGTVYIYDGISDMVDRKEYALDKISKNVRHTIKVGNPVLEAPYEKNIQIVGKVGSRQASAIINAVVEGERPRNATFVSRTPSIPFFVLHDPPGDRSYAKISKGTTFSKTGTTSFKFGGGAGAYSDIKAGVGSNIPFIGKTGGGVHIQAKMEAGRDNNEGLVTNTTFTFTEDFYTSGEPEFVGEDGDVFVGASMNMVYAMTDVLKYDASKKGMVRDTSVAMNLNDFGTVFVYTQHHIKNVLLPQLRTLYSISKTKYDEAYFKLKSNSSSIKPEEVDKLKRTYSEYEADITGWEKTLEENKKEKAQAGDISAGENLKGIVGNNISFSAGAIYENTLTTQRDTTDVTETQIYLNTEGNVGGFVNSGESNEKEIGALFSLRFNWDSSTEITNGHTQTTFYHLEDDDIGDFFSVDLKKNKKYATPVFKTVSGSSSCPHEPGTQYRHLPNIAVSGANEQRNVPSDQPAKFEVLISNRSESDETVEYGIKLIPTSNLGGARVLVAGQDVTNGQANFVIPTGKSFKLPVEVYRGALYGTYEDLTLAMFSACDNSLEDIDDDNIAKPTVKLNAYFQNKCSEIDLFLPGNNWLVNQSNGNKLYVAFSKFDASEASPLTSVALQYRRINQDYENSLWQTAIDIPKSELKDKYYDYTFDVSTLPDSKYELRALAICEGVDVNYSPVYTGVIDRSAAIAFGLPTPLNGILTTSDVMSVTFNKDITNSANVVLKRKDNGQIIPATLVYNDKTIVIKTVPEAAIADYEMMELNATVKNLRDGSGNVLTDSVSWNFVVNMSPIYWSPANIDVNAIEGVQSSFRAKLVNKSALNQNFRIERFPSWLTPSIRNSRIVPLGEQNVDFLIDPNLNTGTYTDTVFTTCDGKRQLLYVTVNVLKTPPNWTVNPSKFRYNMSFVTQFSLDETDVATSTDIRDIMGVFAGDECRGLANIEYDYASKKYVAYVTAYSNKLSNESLSVRFWDTYPGIEYQSKERINFVSNGIVGNGNNPYILHPEGVFQTIPLKAGWNWVSLNVENTDMRVSEVFSKLKSTEGDIVKTLSAHKPYAQYNAKTGWTGPLDSLNIYQSYMVYSAKADTIRVLGQLASHRVDVELKDGWNWLGYPMAVNMELNNYLKNYSFPNGATISSQEEFAQYNATSQRWSGSLKYLRPGKGYKYFVEGDHYAIPVVTYQPDLSPNLLADIPPVKSGIEKVIAFDNAMNVNDVNSGDRVNLDIARFENNMSLTAKINLNGLDITEPGRFEIFAYVDGELVNYVDTLVNGLSFVSINSNVEGEDKPVVIKIYDRITGRTYTAKSDLPATPQPAPQQRMMLRTMLRNTAPVDELITTQRADEVLGTPEHPISFKVMGDADIEVYNSISRNLINIGDTLKYTLKFKNSGPDVAVNSVLVDTLSSGLEFVSATNGLTYDAATHTLKVTKLQLGVDEIAEYKVVLKALTVGNKFFGRGAVSSNNDTETSNNDFSKLTVSVADRRADVYVETQINRNQLYKGEELIYTIKIKNNGPDVARNVVLVDAIPNEFEYVTALNGTVKFTKAGQILNLSQPQIQAGEEVTYSLLLKAVDFGNVFLGQGHVSASNDNNIDFDNNSIARLHVEILDNRVDLAISSDVSKSRINIGDLLKYTITIKNQEPDFAMNYRILDTLSTAFEFVSATGGITYNSSNRTLTAEKAKVNGEEVIRYEITLKAVAVGSQNLGEGLVTVLNDINPNNNVIGVITVIVEDRRANVWVNTHVNKTQLNESEELVYTINVSNNGPDIAYNFRLQDILPADFEFVSSTGGLTYDAAMRKLAASKLQMKSGEEISYTATLKALTNGNFLLGNGNIAADNDNDVDFDNNTINPVAVVVGENKVNFAVTKALSRDRLNIGDQLTYTLTVKNNGPDFGINYKLTDTLSFAFDIVSLSDGLSFDVNKRILTASKIRVAAGEELRYQVVLKANSVGIQTLGKGLVTVLNDSDLSNNKIQPANVNVVDRRANVWVSNQVSTNQLNKSEELTYTLLVSNSGPDVANNFTLQEHIPVGLEFVRATGGIKHNTANNTITASKLQLKSGEEVEYTVVLKAIVAGTIQLGSGSIAADNDNDVDFDNNAISPISVNVIDNNVDFAVSSKANRQRLNIGDELVYSVSVKNNSADFGIDYKLVETLNKAFEFVSVTGDAVYDAVKHTVSATQTRVDAGTDIEYQILLRAKAVGTQLLGNGLVSVNNDINLANNTFAPIAVEVVDRRADVTVTNVISRGQLAKGEELTYTIKVKNNGADLAKNVMLNDILPLGLEVLSVAGDVSFNATTRMLSASRSTLLAGQEAIYTITLRANGVGVFQLGNGAVNADNDNDVDFDNNTIPALNVNVIDNSVDLVVSSQVDKASLNIGEVFNYSIKVKNNGPNNAINTALADQLPVSFDFVSSSNNITYDRETKTLKATQANINVHDEVVYTIKLKANTYGVLMLGNGAATTLNESNEADNKVGLVSVEVVDPRATETKILIPTLFTPNGDGINDMFEILGLTEYYVSNSLTIFNKSYNVVYKKDNYQNDWTGDRLPMGSYGYILKTVDKTGKERVFKGTVTIIYQ
ncbi:gliding motility-associated C-terminal domain-containing protein [Pseudopedobacter sp.]|uniref:T9SS type B sorting domain-containing protein n=1 Tax=Pseudopedobacter sp. TaxID=1936787 RepID=UPI00333FD039